jgi:pSer/pThr/pTyr-binding forkhead associated (FHA) protein
VDSPERLLNRGHARGDFSNLCRMASLLIDDGGTHQVTHELVGDVIMIGRAPSNAIVIDDPTVSGEHASLMKTPTGYQLTDLGSTNGTQCNGVLIADAELKDGDEIRFGSVAAVFRGYHKR